MNCDPGACGLSAPMGYDLVTFANDQATACPTGWATQDVLSDPLAETGACTCGCNVTSQGSCAGVTITRHLDSTTTPSCNMPATTTLTNAGPVCQALSVQLLISYSHYSADPPVPIGGSCAPTTSTNPSLLTASPVRVCQPPASCIGDICSATGSTVCLEAPGNVSCPPTYPTKTLVGTGDSLQCSACSGCSISGGACGGDFTLYTGTLCAAGAASFPADGSCNPPPAGSTGVDYQSYTYDGVLSKLDTCLATGTSFATVGLTGQSTICCP